MMSEEKTPACCENCKLWTPILERKDGKEMLGVYGKCSNVEDHGRVIMLTTSKHYCMIHERKPLFVITTD